MKCPYCGFEENRVIDSRTSKDGLSVRRRRECVECQRRFTTYEYIEKIPVFIIKRDGRREPYNREKIVDGITIACKKRPVSSEQIQDIVDNTEKFIFSHESGEIKSSSIGTKIMDLLKQTDEISYIRFASVYRQFKDMKEFMDELNTLIKNGGKNDKGN
ncbi:MAG: transcriptional regulator NrdR [candidate division WOR-3 bacterium]|nr:transcriptional regulator NrdR [candidate division WOR-3 bacterium]